TAQKFRSPTAATFRSIVAKDQPASTVENVPDAEVVPAVPPKVDTGPASDDHSSPVSVKPSEPAVRSKSSITRAPGAGRTRTVVVSEPLSLSGAESPAGTAAVRVIG